MQRKTSYELHHWARAERAKLMAALVRRVWRRLIGRAAMVRHPLVREL